MEVLKVQERILLIQTAFIGDAVLTLPLIQVLKKNNPDVFIDVICTPVTREIFESSPSVDEVIVLDKRGEQKSFFKLIGFSKKIRQKSYSQVYSPHRSFRTCLLILWSGIRESYGFSNSAIPFVYKNIIKYKSDMHEVERDLSLCGFNNVFNSWKILPEIIATSQIKNDVDKYLSSIKSGKFVAVAPGAVWDTKKYPAKYYEELIEFILQIGYPVVLIGSASDAELCESIKNKFEHNVFSSAGKFTVPGTVELLKKCKLLVSNDSAPTHFGMAADIPVLTIFCSTIPGFGFYPYNGKSYSISYDELNCKPCGIHGYKSCPMKTFDCAHKINMDDLKNKIKQMLDDRE